MAEASNGHEDTSGLEFTPGEELTADGLNNAQDALRSTRWEHNRTLHGTGVASGLEVSAKLNDTAVMVSAGYAIDSRGREVLLHAPRRVDLPKLSTSPVPWVLAIGRPDADAWSNCERVDDTTDGNAEEGVLAWCANAADLPADALALASISVDNRRLTAAPDDLRRLLGTPPIPHMATGSGGSGAWTWYTEDEAGGVVRRAEEGARRIGVQTSVATDAGRFATTPRYFAHAIGSRLQGVSPDGGTAIIWDGFGSIQDARSDRFTYLVVLPQGLRGEGVSFNPASEAGDPPPECIQAWSVAWLGVES
jgi:hypothetical protein